MLSRGGRVLESDVTHLHERLLLGLDTVEERRIRELEEVVVGGGEFVVRLGFGDVLDESFEISRISLDLESVQVENIGSDVVEESRVVCARTEGNSSTPGSQIRVGKRTETEGGARGRGTYERR